MKIMFPFAVSNESVGNKAIVYPTHFSFRLFVCLITLEYEEIKV